MSPCSNRFQLLGALSLTAVLLSAGCCDEPLHIHVQVDAGIDAESDTVGPVDVLPIPGISGRWYLLGTASVFEFRQDAQDRSLVEASLCEWGFVPDMVVCDSPEADVKATLEGVRLRVRVTGAPGLGTFNLDAWVSADGTRIAGVRTGPADVSLRAPTALLPIPPNERRIEDDPARFFVGSQPASLRLATAIVNRGDFSDQAYGIQVSSKEVHSDFGVFWHTERDLSAPQTIAVGDGRRAQAITIGPVPETAPDVATKLVVGIIDGQVVVVEVTMPSGGVYLFRPYHPPAQG